jgi:hypothetical protein
MCFWQGARRCECAGYLFFHGAFCDLDRHQPGTVWIGRSEGTEQRRDQPATRGRVRLRFLVDHRGGGQRLSVAWQGLGQQEQEERVVHVSTTRAVGETDVFRQQRGLAVGEVQAGVDGTL